MSLLPVGEWLDFLGREYLDGYIRAGGAAVKFGVPCDGTPTAAIVEQLAERARRSGYVVATVSSADTRIHLIDRLLHAIAQQVPWDELTVATLRRLAARDGMSLSDAVTAGGIAAQLSTANDLDEDYVRLTINHRIANDVFKDRTLAKDFRFAMTWLCRARLNGGDEGAVWSDQILEWITGQVPGISAMKQYQIYTKVNRANARHLIESLFTWVQRAERPGLVVIVDVDRLTEKVRPADGTVFYTKSMLLDAYEVLRQFIDATDDLTAALIVVVGAEAFLDVESRGRGMGSYQALMNRVYDEVRDRNVVNPMGSLVRVGRAAQETSQ